MAFNVIDAINSTFDRAKERLADPFLGTFTLSFVAYNWDLFAIMVLDDTPPLSTLMRIMLVKYMFETDAWTFTLPYIGCDIALYRRVFWPLGVTGFLFGVWPFVNRWLLTFREEQRKQTHDDLSSIHLRDVETELALRNEELNRIFSISLYDPNDSVLIHSPKAIDGGRWVSWHSIDGFDVSLAELSGAHSIFLPRFGLVDKVETVEAVGPTKKQGLRKALIWLWPSERFAPKGGERKKIFLLRIARKGAVKFGNTELLPNAAYFLAAEGQMAKADEFLDFEKYKGIKLGTAKSKTEFEIDVSVWPAK